MHHDDRCTRVLAVFILGTETSMQNQEATIDFVVERYLALQVIASF